MYQVIKYTYNNAVHEVIHVDADRYNAIYYIQEHVIDYLKSKDGDDKIATEAPKITTPKALEQYILSCKGMKLEWLSPNRIKVFLETKPIGHYIIADCDDHACKWTVWSRNEKKSVNKGFFYNSPMITPIMSKVFDIDLVILPYTLFTQLAMEIHGRRPLALQEENFETRKLCRDFSNKLKNIPVIASISGEYEKNNQYVIRVSNLRVEFAIDFAKYTVPPRKTAIIVAPPPRPEERREIVPLHKQIALEAMRECQRRQISVL